MTAGSWLFAFFPAALLAALAWAVSFRSVLGVLALVYAVPPLCHRVLTAFLPLKPGVYDLRRREFNVWWAAHQLQSLYVAVPALEALLRLVPGLYSAWLRLWGSDIGRGVYWTPRMEVLDRALLCVGDGVVFGHKVELYGHTVMPKGGRLALYVNRVSVGDGAFVGAGSRLAPGVRVEPGAVVPILTDLYMNARFKKEEPRARLDETRPAERL